MNLQPSTISEVQSAVQQHPRLWLAGRGTKPGLSTPPAGTAVIDLSGLAGVLEYEPGEFTFTALAGTRVADVQALLDQHGQYLPFDPLLAERGATLGGTVAAGLSGPGRYRYGGVRDFILGVRYVDGTGELVRGGGKVVKNAAGFDLPKLMVGSLGQYGPLVELTFKVFPRPAAYFSVRAAFPTVAAALPALLRVYSAPLDVDALDLVPGAAGETGPPGVPPPPTARAEAIGAALWVRLGGLPGALPARADRIRALLGGGEILAGPDEAAAWRAARELAWVPAGWSLVKVPLTPGRVAAFDASLAASSAGQPIRRRYSVGGNVAWLATPAAPFTLEPALAQHGLAGLVLFGPPGPPLLGARRSEVFARRVKTALDPAGRFAIY